MRFGGADRYDTADIISSGGWDEADTVIIASGRTYPDALAGAALAKKLDAPVLLTDKNTIRGTTLDAISRLGAKNAVILGGNAAVSEAVEAVLAEKGLSVTRVWGEDRNATAAQIAYAVTGTGTQSAGEKADNVFLVSNAGFADALSVSTAAALLREPILYVNPDGTIPAPTKEAIERLGVKNACIIGGPAAVGPSAEEHLKLLGVSSKRIYGADRYETSIAVNDSFRQLFTPDSIAIATGKDFPDALSGAAFAARKAIPVYLVGEKAPSGLKDKLTAHKVKDVYILGGTAVIPDSVIRDMTAQVSV